MALAISLASCCCRGSATTALALPLIEGVEVRRCAETATTMPATSSILARRAAQNGSDSPGSIPQTTPPLELGHSVEDVHGQLSRRTGQIDPAQRQAMDPHTKLGELRHRAAKASSPRRS